MRRVGLTSATIFILISCGARSDIDRLSADGGPTTCEDMERELAKKLELAQACDPTLDEPSCHHVVEGRCCLEVVSPGNPAAIAAYETALTRARENGCFGEVCKTVKCALPSTGDCVAAPGSSVGRCEPVF